jgi:hypothetical protein
MVALALLVAYAIGFGAFGMNYVVNGVLMAFDERPWWLATIDVVLWPLDVLVTLWVLLHERGAS